jgi:tRNA(Ile2)-agmatinylcytidine synthase
MIGIDDTDSAAGFCTTYLAFSLTKKLLEGGFRITDYPSLVRLNPNVPFKTRGNAAVSLSVESENPEDLFETILPSVTSLSDVEHGANTGLVLLWNLDVLPSLRILYRRALSRIVNKFSVRKLLDRPGVRILTLGNGMGIVGAASCLGFDETFDHTYELIGYRKPDNWGKPRLVSKSSVKEMESITFPETFGNFDHAKDRVLITPHGPDPVFLGVRGNTPGAVLEAFSLLRYGEDLEGYMIYLSNQGTDAHLEERLTLPLKAYSSGHLDGRVCSIVTGTGGHVYLKLRSRGAQVNSAIYEPTGDLVKTARQLAPGDTISVAGGVRRPTARHSALLNTERIQIQSLIEIELKLNPMCSDCNVRMKSEGLAKGFQCPLCRKRLPETAARRDQKRRTLDQGTYLPSPRANRHLTKPFVRYGRESGGRKYPVIDNWFKNEPGLA